MKALILKELRERRLSLIFYCLGAVGLIWLYVSLFPTLQAQMDTYSKLLESFPKGFSQAFGLEDRAFNSLEGFISSEMFSFMWPILIIFFTVSRAGSTIAGEIEKGTIATLLSLPVSRFRLFTAKYTAGVIGFVCFTAISIGSTIPLSLAYSLRPQISNFLTMIFLGIIFAWAIYSASMFISAFARSKTTVYSIMGGVLVVMYALNIIAGLKQSISWLRYLSIFNYFKANMALMHNQITGLSIFILISAIIIFTVPAIYLFSRRDIYA
jgi:ABC-2 type transport system permease protein